MNVTCTGCPAKYSVPDEKVRGKKVRITCKHCGTNIVVDGSALGATQSVLPQVEPAAAPVTARSAGPTLNAVTSAAPAVVEAPGAEATAPTAVEPSAIEALWLVG